MRRRGQFKDCYRTTNETSSASSADSDNDKPSDPVSETDLTEPECPSPRVRELRRKKRDTNPDVQHIRADPWEPEPSKTPNVSAMDLAHQSRYEDPADDTDEDLSKVPEDYGRSRHTKILNFRLKERWARLVTLLVGLRAVASSLTDSLLDTAGPKRSNLQLIRSGKMQKTHSVKLLRTTCTVF